VIEDGERVSAPRPHLIHVGYAKSGSSFLRHWFDAHPQIGYRHDQFAGIERLSHLARAADGLRLRVTSSEILATPTSSPDTPENYRPTQTTVCDNLAELFPAAHILIVTRGFKSMIMSSYSQYVRSGGSQTLEEMVRNAQQDNPWDYDGLITMYRRRFGHHKVLVLPWELLRDSPGVFVSQIEDRFGLCHLPPPPQRVNRSLSPVEMRWYPKISAAVCRVPGGSRLRTRVARWSHNNRLAAPIRLLQRVAPASPVSIDALPGETWESFRGSARVVAADPLFAPYAADYLNEDAE
jgi:hypothetical protein